MKAKGVIRDELEWTSSREYLYWRIRRRLLEDGYKDALVTASRGSMDDAAAGVLIQSQMGLLGLGLGLGLNQNRHQNQMSDQDAVGWLETNAAAMDKVIDTVRVESTTAAVVQLLEGISPAEREHVLGRL